MDIVGIISILTGLIGLPSVILGFLYLINRLKYKKEELELKNKNLKLEIEKEKLKLEYLEKENKKLDRMIDEKLIE